MSKQLFGLPLTDLQKIITKKLERFFQKRAKKRKLGQQVAQNIGIIPPKNGDHWFTKKINNKHKLIRCKNKF